MKEVTNASERVIEAFLELFKKKGFKGTTTRAIAELAGVNEVTIFRNFGSKKQVMEKAVEHISNNIVLKKLMVEEITWDLEHDLYLIAQSYLEYVEKMKDLILMSFREAEVLPELNETIAQVPKQLKQDLVFYFKEMKRQEKLIDTDIEAQSLNFIWLNFGYFLSKARFQHTTIAQSQDNFLKHSIKLFSRGLTP